VEALVPKGLEDSAWGFNPGFNPREVGKKEPALKERQNGATLPTVNE